MSVSSCCSSLRLTQSPKPKKHAAPAATDHVSAAASESGCLKLLSRHSSRAAHAATVSSCSSSGDEQPLSRIDAAASVSNCSRIDHLERLAASVARCSRSIRGSSRGYCAAFGAERCTCAEPIDPVSTRRCSCNLYHELLSHKSPPAAPAPSAPSCSSSVQRVLILQPLKRLPQLLPQAATVASV